MKRGALGLVLGLTLTLTASTARAVPISFVVDPGSSLQVSLSNVFLGSGSGTANVTGAISVDLTAGVLSLNGPSSLSFSDLDSSNGTWTGSGVLSEAQLLGWVAELGMGGIGPVSEGNPGEYDLSGYTLTMVAGTLALPDLGGFGFDWSDLLFEVPITSALSTLDTSGALASLLVPISATATFMTGGNTATLTIVGNVSLTEVPEPGTLMLVGAGLVSLLVTLRMRAQVG